MFGIFKNNKPEIHKMIKQAIQEEERWFNGVLADVRTKVSNNEEFDVFKYCMDVERQKNKDSFDLTDKYVDNASSSAHAGLIRTLRRLVLGHPAVFVSDIRGQVIVIAKLVSIPLAK